MNSLFSVLSISVPVFTLIGIGFISGKTAALPETASAILGKYVFYFSMPAFLFISMARIPIRETFDVAYIAAYGTSLSIVATIAALVGRYVFTYTNSENALHVMGCCYTNSAYLGIPLFSLAYGDISPVVQVTVFQVVFLTPCILFVLGAQHSNREVPTAMFQHPWIVAFRNPIVVASILGMTAGYFRISLPLPAVRICELLGSAGVPTALFSMGLALASAENRLALGMRREVCVMAAAKMVLHPLVATLVGFYVFKLPASLFAPLVLMSAMPTAMNMFIYAQTFDVYVKQSSAVVLVTTAIAVITVTSQLVFLGM